jgi:hypothetical protein
MNGRLFVVDSNWENQFQVIDLCLLDANNQAQCEQFSIYGTELYIHTVKPVESSYYLNAGIRGWRTSKYNGCQLMSNKYCAFPVTHNKLSFIKLG